MTQTAKPLSREYLETQLAKAQAAIAFAVPGADMSYAKAILHCALARLERLEKL